jgi:hypothetical protein
LRCVPAIHGFDFARQIASRKKYAVGRRPPS